jgi:hypothetical protein
MIITRNGTKLHTAHCRGCLSFWSGTTECLSTGMAKSIVQHTRDFEHWVEFNPVEDPELLSALDMAREALANQQ